MKKQTENKYPLTIRGMGIEVTKDYKHIVARLREGEERAEFVAHNIEGLSARLNHHYSIIEKMTPAAEATDTYILQSMNERIQSIHDRLRLVYILTGIAFGAAVIFSIILLGAYLNVGSGGQITILFP